MQWFIKKNILGARGPRVCRGRSLFFAYCSAASARSTHDKIYEFEADASEREAQSAISHSVTLKNR